MEQFVYTSADFCESSESWKTEKCEVGKFDKALCQGWDKAMEDGHFRYKLDLEETKIIGEKGYVAQLNIKRAQERRKPDVINTVNQPFNPASFNFTKIKEPEILFELVKGDNLSCNACNGVDVPEKTSAKERNLVIINVSPLEYGHILLVPNIDACLPQILTEPALRLAIEMMLLSKHRGFRLGFNSLCALASVNHQHMHAYYLDRELFVESSPVEHLSGCLFELTTMPCRGFALQFHQLGIDKLSSILFQFADYCQKNEVAHNFYMTRGPVFNESADSSNRTIRVYFWPREKFIGSMWLKDEAAFNIALVELAGHLPVKIRELFEDLDEAQIESTIREASLETSEYNKIKQDFMKICQPSTS